jgi:hypothetical protein
MQVVVLAIHNPCPSDPTHISTHIRHIITQIRTSGFLLPEMGNPAL